VAKTNSFQAIFKEAADLVARIKPLLPRFTADRRGNVAMIFALSSLPILFAVGMAIDYTSAARRRAKLDAIADAAALSAVTPAEFSATPGTGPSASQAQAVAQQRFNSLASAISGVSSVNGTVTVTDSPSGSTDTRKATVSYTALSQNAFGGIIGMTTMTIGNAGTVATASAAPNINFYILADSSPSMAIPATTTGINQMYMWTYCAAHLVANPTASTTKANCPTSSAYPYPTSASVGSYYNAGAAYTSSSTSGSTTTLTIGPGTPTQTNYGDNEANDSSNGCSFACHESDQTKWVLPGNSSYPGTGTATNPGFVDDYTFAENILGLTLRIDNLRGAISQLGPYAYNVSQVGVSGTSPNKATYQMGVATFDTDWSTSSCTSGNSPLHYITGGSGNSLTLVNTSSSSGGQTISTDASNITMLQMFSNGYLTGTNSTSTKTSRSGTTTTMTSTTNCSNDDGSTALNTAMQDINNIMATPGNGTNVTGDTPQEVLILITDGVNDTYSPRTVSLMNTANCTTIKNRVSSLGLPIRIAVLYLDYSDLDAQLNGIDFDNSYYDGNVEPFDDNTSPTPNPNILSTLQSCASSPSLFQTVTTNQDIGAALNALFLSATATAHLAQ
jgi:Flp pilus assembly protein TadG